MIKTEGIVLAEMKFKETSKIITVYTKELGKISVMAQGAYRPRSQILASTQIFAYCDFQLRKGRNFYYIIQVDLIKSFYSLREDMERLSYGFYLLELIEKALPDEEENEKLFLLLEKGLTILSKLEKNFAEFVAAYELKFISFIGYRPHLNNCVVCSNEIYGDKIKFSKRLGGIVCPNCYSSDISAKTINSNLAKSIDKLMYIPLDELEKLMIPDDVLEEIHSILVDYILYNIEAREFKSLNLIREL
jgi:DNA repair protein RecO (recombination protein O)